METVLITGASGLLGKNLKNLINTQNYNVLAPTSNILNVRDYRSVKDYFNKNKIDTCIHCAAFKDVMDIEKNMLSTIRAIDTNVVGTTNILFSCIEKNTKLVFISTDHVFDGKKGDYDIDDPLNPLSKYAKTKAAAELIVRTYSNSLVIRTSFFDTFFPYDKAFVDQWSTKDYIDIMAPKILNECLSNKKGIVHVASVKKTLYNLAVERKKDVIKSSIKDINFIIPIDTSLK
jgi:dTDP-4-dehydrorhamnose reductase